MRIVALILWFCAGPAFAASGVRDSDIVRLDFADADAFRSAVENHFVLSGTTTATQHSPRVSLKVRVALWTSHSLLPPSAEVLRSKPPSALLLDSSPEEHIAAKTVPSPSHDSGAPYHLGKQTKPAPRPRPAEIEDDEDEKPSLFQRIVGSLLPGD